ncbi:hypothetical protein ZWY2020_010353 [Hordeum vulgare]|nr:hypothetical protein ZWY2020_010353 [Hordeum vulgare]
MITPLEAATWSDKAHAGKLTKGVRWRRRQGNISRNFSETTAEFSVMLKRADYFLHLILQSAPIVIAHQLRYRYIFNHFPTLADEDVIGKTDHEILSGEGIDEMNKVKREFLFNTPLFGPKTFVVYIKPVFSKIGETIGVNYVALDITDEVKTRENGRHKGEEAVQKAKETKHSRSPNITEDTPQEKQMLATMSHEIGSPLSEVLRIAELLATTKLDQEQHQLLELMLSSGNAVLQSIDGILGLSKVESGVIKLQSAIFRPREVVEHVLQTASSFMKKDLILQVQLTLRQNIILSGQKFLIKIPRCSNREDAHQNGIPSNESSTGEAVWLRFDKSLSFLFKRYMHANEEHTTKYGGTGLGLAVCKQLVDLMGGTLTVLSKENEGSTFTVMLPCIIPARQAQ